MGETMQNLLADLEQRLAESELGPRVRSHYSLAGHTTYRVGGPARLFVTVESRSGRICRKARLMTRSTGKSRTT